ncbi:olfactory receptor 51L1-like [Alligator sinensis]|uniref:Olfactory receptor n=1 Tax=Alligator sinensis TaxID=38654 RepID=A0A1U7S6J4_ALLSI|nr:olfactory receptor 51L1-like [Alligator sinensis]
MAEPNSTNSQAPFFLLNSLPGLEVAHAWLSITFSFMFVLALLGNSMVLLVICAEPSLHEPMYLFLAMLAAADLGLATSTFLSMLRIFWSGARELSSSACFTQMFFIHTFTDIELAVILAMAFDRYVAISSPLWYASLLTNAFITKICLAIVVRTIIIQVPMPILLTRLHFNVSNQLAHPYCLHPDIIKRAHSDTRVNSIYGLFVLLSTLGLDLLSVLFSYILILKTVLSIASHHQRLKALNTCVSHVCAVLLFFTPMICLSMVHRFGKDVSPQVYVLLANLDFLVPPMLNPIIYSVRTRAIQRKIWGLFHCRVGRKPGATIVL